LTKAIHHTFNTLTVLALAEINSVDTLGLLERYNGMSLE